mgnify:CR=1 FL=1|jgi:hypothetical protein
MAKNMNNSLLFKVYLRKPRRLSNPVIFANLSVVTCTKNLREPIDAKMTLR